MQTNRNSDDLKQPYPADNKAWRAALYIRLSKDDGDKGESYSITSQKAILKEYLKIHPDITFQGYYVDDGWSGTNFNRPGFIQMMEGIYSGDINCVIVKDLSRFGRNYADAGNYLDNIFVRMKIRFISLNNGIDTASNNMNAANQCISVGITNVINESLAATTSVNVKGTLNVNRAQGKFIGSFATYGYLKDPEDHHKLIIDEEAAPVVRMIFKKFIDGGTIIGIAKDLNEMGIPNPSMYKRNKGMNYRHPAGKSNDGLWPDSSVRRILLNQMYIGTMVQGKNKTISYKIKQCCAVPKEEWIIVENTHEPIISKDTFLKAQSLFSKTAKAAPGKREKELFSGFVKCASCGRSMNQKTNVHSYGTYRYYRCVTSRKMRKGACSNHTIRIDKLEEAVLVTIRKMIDTAASMETVLNNINRNSSRIKEADHINKAIKTQMTERDKCLRMMTDLYPDFKSGIISQEEYIALKADIGQKIKVLDDMLENLQKTAKEYQDGITVENEFLAHFRKYGTIEKLTRSLLTELVEDICVHEGGSITINFKFQDAYESALAYIEANKNIGQSA